MSKFYTFWDARSEYYDILLHNLKFVIWGHLGIGLVCFEKIIFCFSFCVYWILKMLNGKNIETGFYEDFLLKKRQSK